MWKKIISTLKVEGKTADPFPWRGHNILPKLDVGPLSVPKAAFEERTAKSITSTPVQGNSCLRGI